jgi:nucleotide-binding universal stress UspA family protein
MKILCGTSFDAGADTAARFAASLAARTAGSLELMHVLPPVDPSPLMAGGEVQARRMAEVEREGAARALAEATAVLRQVGVAPVTGHLESGPPDACLLLRASQISAELIVLGMAGRSRLERWLLGSVAERVVRLSDRPVLLVPPAASPAAEARSEGLKVLVALDDREASGGAVSFVRHLRAHVPCDVVALRLYWPVEEYRRLGLTGPRELFQSDPEVVRDLETSVRARVGALGGAGAFEIAVEASWGGRAATIVEVARARRCDLIVMGAESRHGLARLSHAPIADRMAQLAPEIPIVFVPAETVASPQLVPVSTVLAATDFSEGGDLAVRAAYGLLAGRGGVVELCHVHERPLASPAYAYDEPAGRLSDVERGALEARLRALVPTDAAQHGIATHVTVVDGGRAHSALVQAAERMRVDALVLGGGRSGATRHALLGSVAQAVVRASRRPVMVVPSPADQA